MRGKPTVIVALALVCLAGTGFGYFLACAAGGSSSRSASNPDVEAGARGFYDAYFDKGYNRGWREGYHQGYQDGYADSPSSPDHALTFDEARLKSNRVAVAEALRIAQHYTPASLYQADVYDCNDMAEELWNAYRAAGAMSYMVVGNTKTDNESFLDCDHCWVVVFCLTEAAGTELTLAVDPQISLVGIVSDPNTAGNDVTTHSLDSEPSQPPASVNEQYIEGYFYDNPADMKADLGARW